MRRFSVWIVNAVLLLGLVAVVGLAQDGGRAKKGNWLTGWLPWGKKATPAPAKEPAAKDKAPAETPEAAAARERLALSRRMAACDRLRLIAQETGDEALHRKADQLEKHAFDLYVERTGMSGNGGPVGAPSADEEILNRHLGSVASNEQAPVPVPPNFTSRSLDGAGGTAARRERP